MSERVDQIRSQLEAAFSPEHLNITDDSHLHAGHAGARDGKGHFTVEIVSDHFSGQSLIKRHRMIYDALAKLMETDIHALSIKAKTQEENS